MSINGAPVMAAMVVAVDVGKNTAVLSVTDSARQRFLGPVEFAMTAPAVAAVVERVCAVLPGGAVKVGVEAAGHYHRPLLESRLWPAGWELLELSPARVSEQRRVQGRRRVKTDAIDLEAITELVLAGHGCQSRLGRRRSPNSSVGRCTAAGGSGRGLRRRTSCWLSWTAVFPG